MLRLVLRPAAYVANLRGLLARGGAGSEPVVGLFAGDVWWMLVMDDPQSARAVSKSELDRSRLGERAAIEIGRANLQHLMPSLESVAVKPAANGVGTIQGDFYTSSRLLLDHDEWGRFASTLKGRLLVVAPDARVLVFADGGVRHAREALQLIAADFAEKSERPLSTTMFQWTPEGWKRAAR
jgi:hypothetical protein